MKVVLAALPAFGHVYPLVPLGLALERAGATVVLATGAEFAGRVPFRTVVGAEESWSFAEATAEIGRRIERDGLGPDAAVGRTLFVELCAPHVVDVMAAVLQRERPDVVVLEQTDVGAAIAAHRAGVRAFCQAIVGWGHQWSDIYTVTAAIAPTPTPGALAEALIDHHGGTGTVIGALAHGLPQVVVPQGADQFWNADHLAAEGAARVVLPGAPPTSVAAAVTATVVKTAPERRAARRLDGVIRQMPSTDSVAALLTG